MILSAKTDCGPVRQNNEDFYIADEICPNHYLIIVCDGMGGANAGDVASRMTAEMIHHKIKNSYTEGMNDNTVKNLLISSIETVNVNVFDESSRNPLCEGMGSTVVLCLYRNSTAYVCNVGDSRLYVFNSDGFRQITEDHSMVQLMLNNGEISSEEVLNHPNKNVITRAVGVESKVEVDFFQEDICDNDVVLLCTDGLSNFVSESQMSEIIKKTDKNIISELLVNEALLNNGSDNITVVTLTK